MSAKGRVVVIDDEVGVIKKKDGLEIYAPEREEAAREGRYRTISGVLGEKDMYLTAHQAEDQTAVFLAPRLPPVEDRLDSLFYRHAHVGGHVGNRLATRRGYLF